MNFQCEFVTAMSFLIWDVYHFIPQTFPIYLYRNVREQIQGVADKIAQNIVAVEPVLEDGMSEVEALLKQPLVFTPQQTVANMIAAVADKTGIRLSLMSWARWQK